MAINTNMYSPQEYELAYNVESTIGTANVTTMPKINIDGPIQFPDGTVFVDDIRAGAGNTPKVSDVFTRTKGTPVRFSFSGTADKTSLKVFMSNAMTIAISTSPASFDIPFNYTQPAIANGAGGDATKTLTFAIIHPEAGKDEVYPGCVIEKLTLTMDDAVEGGRMKFTADVLTQYAISQNQTISGATAYPTTDYFLCDMNTKRQIAGADVVINKLEMVIENTAVGLGSQGANCEPQQYSKGKPGIIVTGVIGVKVDDNTSTLAAAHRAGTTTVFEFSNNATFTAASTLGFLASFCKLTNVPQLTEVDAGSYQDVAFKAYASTSGDLIQVIV